jgi:ACR3 family arsenite efflux pump ArsB
MNLINKLQTLIILIAVALGLFLAQWPTVASKAEYFIEPFLMLMLFGLFLAMPVKSLKAGFLHQKFVGISLMINFLWTPILAYALGYLFLSEHPALWIGFIMLLVTPCTDWYILFTNMAKGNTALSTSILPLNLILQVILLPLYLYLFLDQTGLIPFKSIFNSILLVIIIPFLLAYIIKLILLKINARIFFEQKLLPFFESTHILFLGLAILAMFASEGQHLMNNLQLVYILFVPLILFFTINYVLSRLSSKAAKLDYPDSVSLTLTTLARNSPISLAIALVAFPHTPLIALTLVIGPLIELPILSLVTQLLLRKRNP